MQVTLILSAVSLAILAVTMYVVVLLIKALRKYIRSEPVRKEKAESARSLGEVLKKRRTACKMTQEFVAETLGVSRQAVSKWESGASDPSTTNLMALAKLFGMTPEELLREMEGGGRVFPRFVSSLNDQRGRAAALPLWKHPPGVGDYQIAPLPQSGKGRRRPLAAQTVKKPCCKFR